MDSGGAVADATALTVAQLRAAGQGRLSVTSTLAVDAVPHHIAEGDPSLVRYAPRADQKTARSPGVGDARATLEAGSAAVAVAFMRLQAGSPARSRHDDDPHRAPGGASIR